MKVVTLLLLFEFCVSSVYSVGACFGNGRFFAGYENRKPVGDHEQLQFTSIGDKTTFQKIVKGEITGINIRMEGARDGPGRNIEKYKITSRASPTPAVAAGAPAPSVNQSAAQEPTSPSSAESEGQAAEFPQKGLPFDGLPAFKVPVGIEYWMVYTFNAEFKGELPQPTYETAPPSPPAEKPMQL